MKTDNELIAEFMGNTPIHNDAGKVIGYHIVYGYRNGPTSLANIGYKVSWDWLMPVVAEITRLARGKQLGWFDTGSDLLNGDIKLVYKYVVTFIKWYNQQNSQPL